MCTSTTDQQLQREVVDALAHDTTLVPGEVAVSVRDGVVALSGYVWTYAEKCEALNVTLRSNGVNAVADEGKVRVPAAFRPSDSDMAGTLLRTVTTDLHIPLGAFTSRSRTAGSRSRGTLRVATSLLRSNVSRVR